MFGEMPPSLFRNYHQTLRSGLKTSLALFCLFAATRLPAEAPTGKHLSAVGGECLMYAMSLWGEVYQTKAPGFSLDVRVDGEGTAMRELTQGSTQMAMLARDASQEELSTFTAKWGYPPTRVAVAMDALVFVVNKENPIKGLRIEEVNSIYASDRSMGWPKAIVTWGDAGLKDPAWRDRVITHYTRTRDSSVIGLVALYFPPSVLRDPIYFMPDAMAMTEALAADPAGIGTVNLVEVFASIKAIPMILGDSGVAIPPTPDTVSSGAYPYSRFLYAYVNKSPKKGLDPTLKGFLAFALSEEGQQLVKAAGQAVLSKDIRALNTLKVTDTFSASLDTLR